MNKNKKTIRGPITDEEFKKKQKKRLIAAVVIIVFIFVAIIIIILGTTIGVSLIRPTESVPQQLALCNTTIRPTGCPCLKNSECQTGKCISGICRM